MSPLHRNSKKYTHVYLSVIGVLLAFGVGIFVGQGNFTLRKKTVDFTGKDGFERVLIQTRESAREEVPFSLYWDVWDRLDSKFAGEQPEDTQLFYGSIAGLVAAMGDPYSAFFPPENAEAFIEDLSGSFEGVGAEIGIKDGMLTVIAPLPGSPAERAGVLPGDSIVAVNDEDTYVMSLDEAVNNIRGKRGTAVTLTIRREGVEDLLDIVVTRGIISLQTVTHEMLEDEVGLLKINHFNNETISLLDRSVGSLLSSGAKKIILDLRNNPGGFLETSVQVASEWLPEEKTVVVESKKQESEDRVYSSSGGMRFLGLPTVVLVNEGSASASEILAGALQDHGVATLVGTQTFGKGSVQDFEILQDGSALKLTIAQWLTPKERQIEGVGITPDVLVDEDQIDAGAGEREDIFIKEALEILNK